METFTLSQQEVYIHNHPGTMNHHNRWVHLVQGTARKDTRARAMLPWCTSPRGFVQEELYRRCRIYSLDFPSRLFLTMFLVHILLWEASWLPSESRCQVAVSLSPSVLVFNSSFCDLAFGLFFPGKSCAWAKQPQIYLLQNKLKYESLLLLVKQFINQNFSALNGFSTFFPLVVT